MTLVRIYARASSKDQCPLRQVELLEQWASAEGVTIASRHVENFSGSQLSRPALNELLSQCKAGDSILIESIDRLARLNQADWDLLKAQIQAKGVRIIALDLPSTQLNHSADDDITGRILGAVNSMLIDMLAAMARKDYELRRERQAQGIERARAKGVQLGAVRNTAREKKIIKLLDAGTSINDCAKLAECSRATVTRLKKRLKEERK